MPLFDLTRPSTGPGPVLVEVPHAGTELPADVKAALDAGDARDTDVRFDADLYVDRLFGLAPSAGATLLCARLSRYVVDLNRAPDELDEGLFSSYELRRRGLPRGVVWRCAGDGRPLLARALTRSEVAARIATYYTPYHDTLRTELTALRQRHGTALLIAGHSMPSRGKRHGRDEIRPDVVPGSVGGTSAHPALIDAVERHFRDAGLSVRHDDPYRGGYSTQHYSRPVDGCHAIQIELNRAVYMDERSLAPHPANMARFRTLLHELVIRLGALCESLAERDPLAAL
jgi:N-formylglutamate deformylase